VHLARVGGQALKGGHERPSACAASTVQDLTDSPSSSTVQAPQEVVSQPMLWRSVRDVTQEVHEQRAVLDVRGDVLALTVS